MPSKIFITGASGYLGREISARLVRAGHEVFGLTRDSGRATELNRAGVKAIVGEIGKPESFIGALKNCDVAVHAAYANEGAAQLDRLALEAFADASEDGRLRKLVYTSGLWVHGDTGDTTVDESTPLAPHDVVMWRAAHEEIAMDLAQNEVTVIVFRPSIVYGGSRGIIGDMFRRAKERSAVRVPGTGEQAWCMVHVRDVAEAYALGIEHAASGDRFLLTDGSTQTALEVGEAIARVTGTKVELWPAEEVLARLGDYGKAMLGSTRVSSMKARRDLGWVPRHTSAIGEIEALYKEWLGPREASVS
jgi:nucleoside-diphosphate-sugar epimerase